ncbi:MAG TPA: S9 family peptidase [Candidatus Angelobacter sp.]|nr:S9 family peptidase [Candidatus Angelobacter sp.]
MRQLRLILTIAIIFSKVLAHGQGSGKRPFTFEDMMSLKRIGGPEISPDGRWVLFSVVDVNLQENRKTPHLWLIPLAGGDSRQLTFDQAGEDRGRWAPDGREILFVSSRDGSSQVWVAGFDPDGGRLAGDPHKVTTISTEADGAIWSPDGKTILFVSQVYPDCADDGCNKSRDEQQAASKVKAMVFTRLFFRHWSSYTHFKRSHLFVVPSTGGTAKDITPGDHDVPPFSLGGQDAYAISPDSKEVAFTSNTDEVEATSTNNDVFVVPITGGTPRKLSTSPGSDSTPLYSPDGHYLAWRMQERAGYESDRFRLVVYHRESGRIRDLTEDFDRWVETMVWSSDSREIYFTSEDKGEVPIYRIPVEPAQPELTGKGQQHVLSTVQYPVTEITRGANDDLVVSPDGKTLVFTRMSIQAPNEIYKLAVGSKEAEKLSHINDSVLSGIEMQPLEPFWFAGAGGAKVEGFLLKPPGFNANKKYPMKFLIHGGPQGAWGEEWSYRWNAELFAANGYLVVQINPRGSTGYGQAFVDGVNGDWGGRPFIDLMQGLDYVERTYPFVDKERECALGASYGGYMINWILGHTNRFQCLVSHDGMFNAESAYGSTEELWFNDWEFRGQPWTNRQLYRKWSPHEYAAQFKTPTLVVHGQLDYRLDVSEGFQLFTTLQRLKIPSKMLYFPDEGHWVLKPQNSQLWYKTVNAWVDNYLRK